MDSNTYSTQPPGDRPEDDELAALEVAASRLATRDLDRLPDRVRAERVLVLRRLLDGLEGHWLKELAGVDARGAAGAEDGIEIGSTTAWLRGRLRMGRGAASSFVRTARALFRGPLTGTGQAVCAGELSPAHARVLAQGTRELPGHVAAEAEPVLLQAAGRLDPFWLRRAVGHLLQVADPDGADAQRERRHARRGLWLSSTWEGMVAVDGLLEPEAGQIVLAALEPFARPADRADHRSGGQRTADALTELARRALEGGQAPKVGGVRPQLAVVIELGSLLGGPGSMGGEIGGLGPLDPEACRRLACDGAITRVVVSRQPSGPHRPASHHGDLPDGPGAAGPASAGPDHEDGTDGPESACCDLRGGHNQDLGLAGRLGAALAVLPPILGGAPSQPLDVGRASRVISPAQRTALAVRDGGCVFPGCARPLTWCEGHHLVHWLDGGPTDLVNLVLVCRAHHRAVHEGGWQLARGPDGELTAIPPYRRHPGARRHPPAA